METENKRTRVTRIAENQVFSRADLDSLLDSVPFGHVSVCTEDGPLVVPTAVVRSGDSILIHGSTGSGWMRALSNGAKACVAVTSIDGLIVARSAFESSVRYRSAVLFGTFHSIDGDKKIAALDALTDGLIPGRNSEVRKASKKELAATLVLEMPVSTWSLKVEAGWSEDDEADIATDTWAGVIPMTVHYGEALNAPDLADGIEVPPSVSAIISASS